MLGLYFQNLYQNNQHKYTTGELKPPTVDTTLKICNMLYLAYKGDDFQKLSETLGMTSEELGEMPEGDFAICNLHQKI